MLLGILWVVEPVENREGGLAEALSGNFAVRRIASCSTLHAMLRLEKKRRPEAILMDSSSLLGVSPEALTQVLPRIDVPVVLFADADQGSQMNLFSTSLIVTLRPESDIDLVRIVDQVLRESENGGQGRLRAYGIELDLVSYTVRVMDTGEIHSLPPKEARLLRLLLSNPGVCVSRNVIEQAVWSGIKVGPRTIDSHVSRLRKRLEFTDVEISSRYGDGYSLDSKRR